MLVGKQLVEVAQEGSGLLAEREHIATMIHVAHLNLTHKLSYTF